MPDRHRHDDFIRALLFSLILNFFMVLALLSPRAATKSTGLQPLVVFLTASQPALPYESPATPGQDIAPALTAQKIIVEPPGAVPLPSPGVDPALPTQEDSAAAAGAEFAGAETALPSLPTAGELVSPPGSGEITGTRTISGDKITEDHYTAPEYLSGEKPPYPKRAERNGWEGTVLLTLLINADGEVEKVGIAKTSGYELLDRQARTCVRAWRFQPARRNGHAIAVTVQQPVIFRPTPPKKPQ